MKKLKNFILNHLPLFLVGNLALNTKNSEFIQFLSEHKYWVIRYKIAENSYTTSEILKKLAADTDATVRYIATQNPNATEEVYLTRIAHISLLSSHSGKLKHSLLK